MNDKTREWARDRLIWANEIKELYNIDWLSVIEIADAWLRYSRGNAASWINHWGLTKKEVNLKLAENHER